MRKISIKGRAVAGGQGDASASAMDLMPPKQVPHTQYF